MKTKLEVHTIRFGTSPWLDACAATLEAWCERHGYSLKVWDDSHGLETPKLVQKNMLEEFTAGSNTHMLYVDADVFVHANAPEFPVSDSFMSATDRWHRAHNKGFRQWAEDNYGADKRYESWDYINAGVWATNKKEGKKLLAAFNTVKFIEQYQEQHWFNVCIVQSGIKTTPLHSKWNRYCRDYEPSWFWHLWGDSKMENLNTLKRLGLLEREPQDGFIFNVQPRKFPKNSKVIELEFILNCGLGNQMFEWAAAYSLSRTLHLPLRWTWKPSQLRDFGLTAFGIGENPARNEPLLMNKVGQGHRRLFDIAKQRINSSTDQVCRIACPFQAEECFKDHADEIAAIFQLPKLPLPNPEGTTPVGVQVRRGDYLKHSRLNVTTPEYFVNGMRFISERVANCHFIVVSDDPKWCEEFFGYRDDVSVMPEQTPAEGIQTLASCHHHVISNSTFGWWGAWLGERRHGGLVVTPEVWHHGGNSYGEWNPIPTRWHRVGLKLRKDETVRPQIKTTVSDVERAIVYPWKADAEKWHELRYSLRSVEKFFEDKDCPIYILGTAKPSWLIEGGRVKYIGAYTYAEALSKGVQMAQKVLWMNDDIVLLRDTTWADCEKTLYMKDVSDDFLTRAVTKGNTWREGVVRLLQMLHDEGIKNQKVFSTHTPYVFHRALAVEILEKYGLWEKFPMELAYFHHHAVNPTQITTEKVWGLPFGEAQFLNYADKILTPALKTAIRDLLPEAPQWEMVLNYGL